MISFQSTSLDTRFIVDFVAEPIVEVVELAPIAPVEIVALVSPVDNDLEFESESDESDSSNDRIVRKKRVRKVGNSNSEIFGYIDAILSLLKITKLSDRRAYLDRNSNVVGDNLRNCIAAGLIVCDDIDDALENFRKDHHKKKVDREDDRWTHNRSSITVLLKQHNIMTAIAQTDREVSSFEKPVIRRLKKKKAVTVVQPIQQVLSYCGEDTIMMTKDRFYISHRGKTLGFFYQDPLYTPTINVYVRDVAPRFRTSLYDLSVHLYSVKDVGPQITRERMFIEKMVSKGQESEMLGYQTIYDWSGGEDDEATKHRWIININSRLMHMTASQVQLCLEKLYADEHNGLIFIPTSISDTQFLARWIKPFPGGVFCNPINRFPGYISALTEKQRDICQEIFDGQNPSCAAMLGCLCRREYRLAENDPRLWRTIHVCLGAKPGWHQYSDTCPSLTDVVDMNSIFERLYVVLGKFGQKYEITRTLQQQTRTVFELFLYETLVSVGGQRIIGLAINVPEKTPERDFQKYPSIVLNYLHQFDAESGSGYFIPRLIRIFNLEVLPDLADLQMHGISPMSIGPRKNVPWIYTGRENGYLRCDQTVIEKLQGTKFVSLWQDTLGLSNNINLSGDHSVGYGFLCSISQAEQANGITPKVWWHKACIDAKKNIDERVAKYGPKYGFTARHDCECCGEEMQQIELSEKGTFKKGSICEDRHPRNMIDSAGSINIAFGAGNYVARYSIPATNPPDQLVDIRNVSKMSFKRPEAPKEFPPTDYREFLQWERK